MIKKIPLIPLIFFILTYCVSLSAAIAENMENEEVTWSISPLENPPENIQQFKKQLDTLQWNVIEGKSVYLKSNNKNSWIRVDITNHNFDSTDRLLEVATTDIHSADLYEIDLNDEKYSLNLVYADLGMDGSFRERPINYRNLVYPVTLPPQTTRSFLFNIQHGYELKLNLHLWSKKQFYENSTRELVIFGMIYGALIMIAIYNLFIYFSIREKSHLFFVMFSIFIGLFISLQEGHLQQFIATDTFWTKDIFYSLMTALMCFFFTLFSIHFLDLERWSIWQMRLLMALGSIASLLLVFIGLMQDSIIFSHQTLFIIITLYGSGIAIGLYVWHRGVSLAGFYTLAIFLCNIGLLLETASHMQFFPWTKLTYSYASIGNTVMIMVFAYAIAYKMRLLQKEKLIASMKLVKLTEENAQNSVDSYKAKLHEIELSKEANVEKIESRAKNDFLATMSHEIRTPMNGVLGMTELLNDTDLDNKQKHYATSISNSAKALLNAINDLLDYTKIESGKMELDFRLFNLEKIIDDCISIFALHASESKVNFSGMVKPETPIQLKGDPEKVRQILLNLLGNAFNLTNKNDISIKAFSTGKSSINSIEIRFEITTYGIELSEEDNNLLLTVLDESNSKPKRHSGHELGLTVSRQLAELMQGSIGVDTSNNNTTLWFTARFILPHKNEEKTLTDRTKILSNRRVLICDTHTAFTESVQTLTKSWGMHSSFANNSKDMIDILLKDPNSYQVVLIAKDLLTPEVQLAIRQSNLNHNFITSVILVTHSCYSFDKDELKKQGIHCILENPYTTSQLFQSLLKAMGIDSDKTVDSSNVKSLSVIIADDNNVNLMVIEGLLKKLKTYPHSATDGQEAIELFQTSKSAIDLIFMDCEMPGVDGYEATSKIRQIEKEKHLKPCVIIGLSAHSSNQYRESAISSGMNDFLIKPVNIEDIENVLERVRNDYYKNTQIHSSF